MNKDQLLKEAAELVDYLQSVAGPLLPPAIENRIDAFLNAVRLAKRWCMHCKKHVVTYPPDKLEPPDHIRCKECNRVVT